MVLCPGQDENYVPIPSGCSNLVLATGVHDIFPVPGWDLFWGRELFHCAWCAEVCHLRSLLAETSTNTGTIPSES